MKPHVVMITRWAAATVVERGVSTDVRRVQMGWGYRVWDVSGAMGLGDWRWEMGDEKDKVMGRDGCEN